ncbi:hypothetical protein MYOV003v1_p0119 [Vibrio phage 207E48.1]|nr:hypothetical protein MYOV003v1_p0119 [Vibrio phage 207E48.1]
MNPNFTRNAIKPFHNQLFYQLNYTPCSTQNNRTRTCDRLALPLIIRLCRI